jgi:hypothetical protein
MSHQDPKTVKSPRAAVSHLKVVYDGGEQAENRTDWEGWSVAELEWHEEPVLGVRWNGSTKNPAVSAIGNPQSRGLATWFVLPKPLEDVVRAQLKNAPLRTEAA